LYKLLLPLLTLGMACATTNPDPRKCCERVSLHQKQMTQFNRYCKVALFLKRSRPGMISKQVQKNAATAVDVCKYVFGVVSDQDLVIAGDEQEYQRVQSYILLNPAENDFWRENLPCDPEHPTCEEF
jgi:hypothetical protein